LCCGNFGRISFLSIAGATRGDAALTTAADDLASKAIQRSRERGSYGVNQDPTFAPGLLQGMAGIGYELLRMKHPRRLPPILLFA
jgi:lantibiotic modifying enzyme